MNNRIQQLILKSGVRRYVTDGKMLDAEKLANLIAEECAELCAYLDGAENRYSQSIRNHFGLKSE